MTFQEELKAQLAEMIPEDKRSEFEERAAGVFDRMGQYFQKTEASIADCSLRGCRGSISLRGTLEIRGVPGPGADKALPGCSIVDRRMGW